MALGAEKVPLVAPRMSYDRQEAIKNFRVLHIAVIVLLFAIIGGFIFTINSFMWDGDIATLCLLPSLAHTSAQANRRACAARNKQNKQSSRSLSPQAASACCSTFLSCFLHAASTWSLATVCVLFSSTQHKRKEASHAPKTKQGLRR